MNHSIIIYMLGWIMNIEAALMLIPILTAVVYKEGIISCYAGVAVVCAVLGFLCTRKKPKVRMFFENGLRIADRQAVTGNVFPRGSRTASFRRNQA